MDDEKYLDVCSFPPRIGRHGVKGCKAEHINFYILRRHPSECDKRERNKNYKKDKENYLLNRDDFFICVQKQWNQKVSKIFKINDPIVDFHHNFHTYYVNFF